MGHELLILIVVLLLVITIKKQPLSLTKTAVISQAETLTGDASSAGQRFHHYNITERGCCQVSYKDDEQRRSYQRAYYQANKETKKRSKPNPETKRKYNEKTYSRIVADIPKDLAERFRAVTAERGDSQATIIKAAIEAYLAQK